MRKQTTFQEIFDKQNEVTKFSYTFPFLASRMSIIKTWETANSGTIGDLITKQTELYEANVCKNEEGRFEFLGADRPKFLSTESEARFNEEWSKFLKTNCTIVL